MHSWRRPSPPAARLPPAGARPQGANAVIDVLLENTSRARSRASRRGGRRVTARSKHLEEALPMVPLISWQSISERSAEDLPARQCCGWRRQHERRSWRGRRGRGCRSGSRRRLQWPYWPSSCSCAAPRRAARTHSSSGMSCWVADKLQFFMSKHDRRRLLVRHVAEDAGTQPEANGTTRSARPASARVRAADRTSQGCHRQSYD